jgi:hypothetical protein
MIGFKCDVCDKVLDPKDTVGWFTVAVDLGGKEFRAFLWPTGSRLKESHDSLHHVCCPDHLKKLLTTWIKNCAEIVGR